MGPRMAPTHAPSAGRRLLARRGEPLTVRTYDAYSTGTPDDHGDVDPDSIEHTNSPYTGVTGYVSLATEARSRRDLGGSALVGDATVYLPDRDDETDPEYADELTGVDEAAPPSRVERADGTVYTVLRVAETAGMLVCDCEVRS